ncbi:hypothetical protein M3P05_07690 [Sansalvadorimonas sp. 2012CJ34-2]|uniref:Uncharacterized protein n=1 Tax=Parendozoicomonas callyspongiae TaxID=2942213 RepID=A0ABT0PF27_9GAMM|nr:hypothetical protein [Sansalvadorimonas sp. 2012CJ34-2]MCL6269821.1 hypothetical protein [Sansalvadorimonas sp. 2012CJ34-2]
MDMRQKKTKYQFKVFSLAIEITAGNHRVADAITKPLFNQVKLPTLLGEEPLLKKFAYQIDRDDIHEPAVFNYPQLPDLPSFITLEEEEKVIPFSASVSVNDKQLDCERCRFSGTSIGNVVFNLEPREVACRDESLWDSIVSNDQKKLAGWVLIDDYDLCRNAHDLDFRIKAQIGNQLPLATVFSSQDYRHVYQSRVSRNGSSSFGSSVESTLENKERLAIAQRSMLVLQDVGLHKNERRLIRTLLNTRNMERAIATCNEDLLPEYGLRLALPENGMIRQGTMEVRCLEGERELIEVVSTRNFYQIKQKSKHRSSDNPIPAEASLRLRFAVSREQVIKPAEILYTSIEVKINGSGVSAGKVLDDDYSYSATDFEKLYKPEFDKALSTMETNVFYRWLQDKTQAELLFARPLEYEEILALESAGEDSESYEDFAGFEQIGVTGLQLPRLGGSEPLPLHMQRIGTGTVKFLDSYYDNHTPLTVELIPGFGWAITNLAENKIQELTDQVTILPSSAHSRTLSEGAMTVNAHDLEEVKPLTTSNFPRGAPESLSILKKKRRKSISSELEKGTRTKLLKEFRAEHDNLFSVLLEFHKTQPNISDAKESLRERCTSAGIKGKYQNQVVGYYGNNFSRIQRSSPKPSGMGKRILSEAALYTTPANFQLKRYSSQIDEVKTHPDYDGTEPEPTEESMDEEQILTHEHEAGNGGMLHEILEQLGLKDEAMGLGQVNTE